MGTPTKIIYVPWTDWERGMQFLTDTHTQVRVARAAIPVIFVPGIMGSRLKGGGKGGGRVWDPDDMKFMLRSFYNATGAERVKLLIKSNPEVDVAGAGGPPTFSFRERMQMHFSVATPYSSTPVPPNWDWLGLPSSMPAEDRLSKTIDILVDHGWDQISWQFYGSLLLKLAAGGFSELSRCFIHPIYAFGYNWVGNNKDAGEKLAARITEIINKENFAHHPCDQVILVSHSMGGLVTRSCVVGSAKAAGQVLGIIHGAQPATGAPAAYRRMRAGFEGPHTGFFGDLWASITSVPVLGSSNATVVPILGNCVGGLELLPTKDYVTNTGSKQWLSLSGKDGKQASALPQHGDPYSEIYPIQQSTPGSKADPNASFLQLIPDPRLLSPGGSKNESRYGSGTTDPVATFKQNLDAASSFHRDLKLTVHPNTYIAYTGHGGPKTYDKIHFSYRREQHGHVSGVAVSEMGAVPYSYDLPPLKTGSGIDLDLHPPGSAKPQYFHLDNQDGNGDGTVPVSSSKALITANGNVQKNNNTVRDDKGRLVSADIPDAEHGAFFSKAEAINFTFMAIRQLDWKYRLKKIGK